MLTCAVGYKFSSPLKKVCYLAHETVYPTGDTSQFTDKLVSPPPPPRRGGTGDYCIRVCPSVRPSVRLSVVPSVRPSTIGRGLVSGADLQKYWADPNEILYTCRGGTLVVHLGIGFVRVRKISP